MNDPSVSTDHLHAPKENDSCDLAAHFRRELHREGRVCSGGLISRVVGDSVQVDLVWCPRVKQDRGVRTYSDNRREVRICRKRELRSADGRHSRRWKRERGRSARRRVARDRASQLHAPPGLPVGGDERGSGPRSRQGERDPLVLRRHVDRLHLGVEVLAEGETVTESCGDLRQKRVERASELLDPRSFGDVLAR